MKDFLGFFSFRLNFSVFLWIWISFNKIKIIDNRFELHLMTLIWYRYTNMMLSVMVDNECQSRFLNLILNFKSPESGVQMKTEIFYESPFIAYINKWHTKWMFPTNFMLKRSKNLHKIHITVGFFSKSFYPTKKLNFVLQKMVEKENP